ncbi:ras-related protein Rab-24-like [Diprion similis]|uniref:ras-related protein Rab-24-like n=1 Tax=Diprion similis TaxID=362088 RepID=UPI001EF82478|nr:ras-related protein Rab-24-like [Diprion similis]
MYTDMPKVDLKIVLLGSSNVGKTSLLERFIDDRFNENLPNQSTIGAAFASKEVCVNNVKFTLGVWDTAGSERYQSMTKLYYRGAKAAIVCYDVTNLESWERAKYWVRELRSVEETCVVYLCGTKKDILDEGATATPDLDIVKSYAAGIQCKFYLVSNKTGEKTSELFDEISKDYISDPDNLHSVMEAITLTANSKTDSRCCTIG